MQLPLVRLGGLKLPGKHPERDAAYWREYRKNRRLAGRSVGQGRERTPESRAQNLLRVKYNQDRLRTALRSIKEQFPCTDCGQFFPHYSMEFDHVEPLNNPYAPRMSAAASQGLNAVLAELKVVELVCANCHGARTWLRQHPDED